MSTNGKFQGVNRRLDSWKEIAAFFRCDERTVRRWEKERRMPVHRAPGGSGGRVFAYTDELSAWLVAPASEESAALPRRSPAPLMPGATRLDAGAMPLDRSAMRPEGTAVRLDGRPARLNGTATRPDGSAMRLDREATGPDRSATGPSRDRDPATAAAPLTRVNGSGQGVPFAGAQDSPSVAAAPSVRAPPAAVVSPGQRDWSFKLLVASAFLALPAMALVWMLRQPDTRLIAVLPFANGGAAESDFLSDGIGESLIDNLALVPHLKVRPWGSVSRYRGQEFRSIDVHKVGGDLGVSMLVSGQVVIHDDVIDVHAELTDVRDDVEVWGQRYTGSRSDIVLLQQRIAGDIADKLRSKLSPAEREQIVRQGTHNPEAYQLFLKGRYAWNRRTPADLDAAVGYFNQAIDIDPGYAQAFSALADVYSVRPNYWGNPNEDFPKSNAAARRALELEPSMAHPHAVLGENQIKFEWDFAGGEAEFKKAFQLDSNDATAHQWYADDLGTIGGREREALAEIGLAHQLDPLSPIITRVIGSVLVSARRYDQAIAVCSELANENPNFAVAHDCLNYAYWGKRMYPQAIEELKIYAKLNGGPLDAEYAAALEEGFRSGGWQGALAKAVENQLALRKSSYVSPLMIARLYAELGDAEQAFKWLDTAYQEHDRLLIGLNTYFQLDPVRSDPRFAELVRKVGLPH